MRMRCQRRVEGQMTAATVEEGSDWVGEKRKTNQGDLIPAAPTVPYDASYDASGQKH